MRTMRFSIESATEVTPTITRVVARGEGSELSVDMHVDWYETLSGRAFDMEFSSQAPTAGQMVMHGTVAQRSDKVAIVSNGGLFTRATGPFVDSLAYGDDVYTIIRPTQNRRKRKANEKTVSTQ